VEIQGHNNCKPEGKKESENRFNGIISRKGTKNGDGNSRQREGPVEYRKRRPPELIHFTGGKGEDRRKAVKSVERIYLKNWKRGHYTGNEGRRTKESR